MPLVNFLPANKSIEVDQGVTILEAGRRAGVIIESPCDGMGTCGKCKVRIPADARQNIDYTPDDHLSARELAEGFILGCHARISGDLSSVFLFEQHNATLNILEHGSSFDFAIENYISKKYISSSDVTLVFGGNKALGFELGNTEALNYGVVVDIGTTTLVTSLVDLETGRELDATSSLNPQALHAQDVLSRIKIASETEGLHLLHSVLIVEINKMIQEIADRSRIANTNIYEVVLSGNTCMLHLAAGVNPYSLGKFTYTPEIFGGSHLKASELDLAIAPFGVAYLPPIVSAYVGADITSGLLASQLYTSQGNVLFIDIGTNGEMVMGFDGRLSATSTAAGPAFEGMNITYGMRANRGAVELFQVETDGTVTVKTIGGSRAQGICGSGLMDIVGELVAYGVINKNGKFVDPATPGLLPALRERLVEQDGKPAFQVAKQVYLLQKDIRQVQLAKGAVRAGVEFLLQSKGLGAAEVDKVLIAGSFGYHLRARSLINLGLLPAEFDGKIEFVGNTSKSGGHALLLNNSFRREMESVVKRVEVVELASYSGFDRLFVQCLGF